MFYLQISPLKLIQAGKFGETRPSDWLIAERGDPLGNNEYQKVIDVVKLPDHAYTLPSSFVSVR